MTTNHTPGPWHYGHNKKQAGNRFVDDRGWFFGPVGFGLDIGDIHLTASQSPEEQEANARLIAASPDLLNGVREAWNALRKLWSVQTEGEDLWPLVERLRLLLIQANPSEFARVLTCQGDTDCKDKVTHIDNKGYTYCEKHGVERRGVRPCRKLLKREIATLERGDAIAWKSENRSKATA